MLGPKRDKEVIKPTIAPREVSVNEEGLMTKTIVTEKAIHTVEDFVDLTPWVENTSVHQMSAINAAETGTLIETTYFSRVNNTDTISDSISSEIAGAFQQYIKIENFPFYLAGSVVPTISDDTKITEVTAEGTIVGSFPPNKGDYLYLDLGYNKRSLFQVTEALPLSIWDCAYKTTLRLVELDLGAIGSGLSSKVVTTLHYMRENHKRGVKYLLSDKELNEKVDRNVIANRLEAEYNLRFTNVTLDQLGFTINSLFIMDPMVNDFINKTFTNRPNIFNINIELHRGPTVYDSLLRRLPQTNVVEKVKYMIADRTVDNPSLYGILYSGINYLAIQDSYKQRKVVNPGLDEYITRDSKMNGATYLKLNELGENKPLEFNLLPLFPNVLLNETYIFSFDFYQDVPNNTLEELVLTFIKDGVCNFTNLKRLVSNMDLLNETTYFYITPILIFLLRASKDGL